MFRFEIGLDPVLFTVGPLAFRWYSMAILAAIIVAFLVIRREFARKRLPVKDWDILEIGTVAGGIIGARLFHVFDNPDPYLREPAQILAIHQGGLAIYGAVIGGVLAVAVLSRVHAIPFRGMIDAIAPGLLLGQAIGRIGCIVNGDAWGHRPTRRSRLSTPTLMQCFPDSCSECLPIRTPYKTWSSISTPSV